MQIAVQQSQVALRGAQLQIHVARVLDKIVRDLASAIL